MSQESSGEHDIIHVVSCVNSFTVMTLDDPGRWGKDSEEIQVVARDNKIARAAKLLREHALSSRSSGDKYDGTLIFSSELRWDIVGEAGLVLYATLRSNGLAVLLIRLASYIRVSVFEQFTASGHPVSSRFIEQNNQRIVEGLE